jgi:aryl-alcohol dehydrogenase
MAAAFAGCSPIIAVDLRPERLALACNLGATHMLNADSGDLVQAILAVIGRGVDFALDTTGRPEVIRQAVEALAYLGTCGIIGEAPSGTELRLPYSGVLIGGRTVRGIVQGDSVPDLFIPALIELYRNGRFPLDRLMAFYPFEQINEAARASEQGEVVKPILRISTQPT